MAEDTSTITGSCFVAIVVKVHSYEDVHFTVLKCHYGKRTTITYN